jgi:hypothetical protein
MCYPYTNSYTKSQLIKIYPNILSIISQKTDVGTKFNRSSHPELFFEESSQGEFAIDEIVIIKSESKSTYGKTMYDVTLSSSEGRKIEQSLSCSHVTLCAKIMEARINRLLKETMDHWHSLINPDESSQRLLDVAANIRKFKSTARGQGCHIKAANGLLSECCV